MIVTPHVAFSSAESLIDMKLAVCKEVARVLGGEPPRQACNQLQKTAYRLRLGPADAGAGR